MNLFLACRISLSLVWPSRGWPDHSRAQHVLMGRNKEEVGSLSFLFYKLSITLFVVCLQVLYDWLPPTGI